MKRNWLFIGGAVLLVGLIVYFAGRIFGPEMGSPDQSDWIVRLAGVIMLIGIAMVGFGWGKNLSGKK